MLTRFRSLLGVVVVVAALGAGCSGSNGANADGTCALIDRLARSADALETADVSDPDAFDRTLKAAVSEYTDAIDSLIGITPRALHRDLNEMKAAVQQFRFEDAIDARSQLDEYAREKCGTVNTTTTAVPDPTIAP